MLKNMLAMLVLSAAVLTVVGCVGDQYEEPEPHVLTPLEVTQAELEAREQAEEEAKNERPHYEPPQPNELSPEIEAFVEEQQALFQGLSDGEFIANVRAEGTVIIYHYQFNIEGLDAQSLSQHTQGLIEEGPAVLELARTFDPRVSAVKIEFAGPDGHIIDTETFE